MAGPHTQEFTDANFESEVLASTVPVLVDFWADWCGPCKALAPVIDDLATTYTGKVKIGKLDVNAHPQIGARFSVSSIPTIILFRKGQLVDRIIGWNGNRKGLQAKVDQLVEVPAS